MEIQEINNHTKNGGVVLNGRTIITFINTDGISHKDDDDSKQESVNKFLKTNYYANERRKLKIEKLTIETQQSRRIISGDMMTDKLKAVYWQFKFMDEKHKNWWDCPFHLRNKNKIFNCIEIIGIKEKPELDKSHIGEYIVRPTVLNFDNIFILNNRGHIYKCEINNHGALGKTK